MLLSATYNGHVLKFVIGGPRSTYLKYLVLPVDLLVQRHFLQGIYYKRKRVCNAPAGLRC